MKGAYLCLCRFIENIARRQLLHLFCDFRVSLFFLASLFLFSSILFRLLNICVYIYIHARKSTSHEAFKRIACSGIAFLLRSLPLNKCFLLVK